MATENTASVILQGAQLNADAMRTVQQAVTTGFGQMQSSIRDAASIYNGMIQSLNDVRRTEVDSWYKQEQVKLDKKRIEIDKNYKNGELEYRKSYLQFQKDTSKKEASRAPLVAATKVNIDQNEYKIKQLDAELVRLRAIRDGGSFDDKGNFVTGRVPQIHGSPEHAETEARIKEFESEKVKLLNRNNELSGGVMAITLGADPNETAARLFPELNPTMPNQNDLPLGSPGFGTDDNPENPLLPNLPSVKPPSPPTPKPTADFVDPPVSAKPKDDFVGPPVSAKPPVTTKTEAPVYMPLDSYLGFVNRLSAETKDSKPFRVDLAEQAFSKLSKEDQNKITKSANNALKDFFVTAGEAIARGYEKDSTFNEGKTLERITGNYKAQLLKLGLDPSKVDIVEAKIQTAITDFRASSEFRKLEDDGTGNTNVRTLATVNRLKELSEHLFGEELKGQPEPSEIEKKLNAYNTNPKLFEPDGSLSLDYDEEIDKKQESIARFTGFAKEFKDKLTNRDTSGDNNFPINREYVDWIKKLKPEELGVETKQRQEQPVGPYGTQYPIDIPRNKEDVKRDVLKKIQLIISDPQKAFYFWLDKNKKVKPEQLPDDAKKTLEQYQKNQYSF